MLANRHRYNVYSWLVILYTGLDAQFNKAIFINGLPYLPQSQMALRFSLKIPGLMQQT